MIIELTKELFLKEIFNYEQNQNWTFEGKLPSIVYFYEDWCEPCQTMAPILEQLSNEYNDIINIYNINTETEEELAGALGIRDIPSMLFCPKKGIPQMAVGAIPKNEIVNAINKLLLTK